MFPGHYTTADPTHTKPKQMTTKMNKTTATTSDSTVTPTTHSITLPNGETLTDAICIENALLSLSKGIHDPSTLFAELSATPKQDKNAPILFSTSGLDPLMVTGEHPSLHYRGNALKRHKIWLQSDFAAGLLKYGYTGWQHSIAAATRAVESIESMNALMNWLNSGVFSQLLKDHGMPPCSRLFNHAIFTRYENHEDYIGMHSDKEKDFHFGSYFVVIKLGAPRDFVLSTNEGEEFWRKQLPSGTMVIVRAKGNESGAHDSSGITECANAKMKHGVPMSKVKCGPSGSIVFRCIKTVVPWEQVHLNVARAAKQKVKRLQNKRKHSSSSSSSSGTKK